MLLFLLLACTREPGPELDSRPEADADTDSDTDLVEDCGASGDEDGDGLADCEDPDCVDLCMEDCGNELDDDGDGLTDCEDPECVGDGACQDRYRVEVTVDLDELRLGLGPAVEASIGQPAALWASGQVSLAAQPLGEGEPFSCTGMLSAVPGSGSELAEGPCGGCEARVAFRPTAFWVGLCPVEVLPIAYLGFSRDAEVVQRDLEGLWLDQYVAGAASWTSDGADAYGVLEDIGQETVWAFEGAY